MTYERGRIDLIHTDADWVVPSKNDPHVIIMVSYQETTSSGQTNKARDMYRAYERVRERNMRYKEKRVFINFVDGIGWLARKADFKRLVEECHYFLNLYACLVQEKILRNPGQMNVYVAELLHRKDSSYEGYDRYPDYFSCLTYWSSEKLWDFIGVPFEWVTTAIQEAAKEFRKQLIAGLRNLLPKE